MMEFPWKETKSLFVGKVAIAHQRYSSHSLFQDFTNLHDALSSLRRFNKLSLLASFMTSHRTL